MYASTYSLPYLSLSLATLIFLIIFSNLSSSVSTFVIIIFTFPVYLLSALACNSAEPAVASDAALKFLISTSLAVTSLFCLMISLRTAFSVLNLLPLTSLLVILLSKI
ncbi:hypothetical protein [Spiroplasma endosymbiont of Cleonymus obscurus]|uniref:hypothetical protein n=1 Tax=Spiroplasma endosymbiont of Cleonymus obscurus TaxID=3066324 RepID=UPI0037DD4FD2